MALAAGRLRQLKACWRQANGRKRSFINHRSIGLESNVNLCNQIRFFSSKRDEDVLSYWKSWQGQLHDQSQFSFVRTFKLPDDPAQLRHMLRAIARTDVTSSDIIPKVVIKGLCEAYSCLPDPEKVKFLLVLAEDLQPNDQHILEAIRNYDTTRRTGGEGSVSARYKALKALRTALTPLHEVFFRQVIAQMSDGMVFLVNLRADLIRLLRRESFPKTNLYSVRALDDNVQSLLGSYFAVRFLDLERITYADSSAELVEKIARYEAVHPIRSLSEIKRRLGYGRRCYAFFHPSMPGEPLVFIHVALVPEIAPSMQYIDENTGEQINEEDAKCAIFYSITSAQPGLKGVELGTFLIKQVAQRIGAEVPNVGTFSTLSPIPSFSDWLLPRLKWVAAGDSGGLQRSAMFTEGEVTSLVEISGKTLSSGDSFSKHQKVAHTALSEILATAWWRDPEMCRKLKPILMRLAASYLVKEKRRGRVLCPVGNFHVRNGAVMERLNWLADKTPKGIKNSFGMMINYKYNLEDVEKNNEAYVGSGIIPVSSGVSQWIE